MSYYDNIACPPPTSLDFQKAIEALKNLKVPIHPDTYVVPPKLLNVFKRLKLGDRHARP